ncbi:hypothetical protein [Acinetobacter zhairhuonensis]|uniref:hypothetical protein n=1 Tax=Acinetobacter sp. A7.4 TaxID=2919921 RepID=UPI001F4E7AFD|nr:hypothetical protein [Acinetobacter sp. A7.4]MCJ8160234.1 hypothetical protein [Acinetobacter sp. A7.4]
MYFLLKEDSLQSNRKIFVTGGLGADYRDPSITTRYVTHNVEEALNFKTPEDAAQFLCRGYVVAKREANDIFIPV